MSFVAVYFVYASALWFVFLFLHILLSTLRPSWSYSQWLPTVLVKAFKLFDIYATELMHLWCAFDLLLDQIHYNAKSFLNQAHTCCTEIVLPKVHMMCVDLPYNNPPIFVCPYKLTHMSNFLSGKYSLYTWNEGPINPTISFYTNKLWFKRGAGTPI